MPTPTRGPMNHLPAYSLAEKTLPGVARPIVLAQNELGVGPSPLAKEAAREAMSNLNRYSDASHGKLRQAIADHHGLNPDHILCGAGSMELLSLLALVYCEPGADMVMTEFGYKFFQIQCAVAGSHITVVPEPDMKVDVEAVARAVTKNTRLVFIVNPNNPTGALMAPGAVTRLRRLLPERVLLVLDCAYAEFVSTPGYETGFNLVDQGANVVVLRTFSKAYGLAGLRVGWLYGPTEVIGAIAKVRAPNSVTTPGLAAAEAAVKDQKHIKKVVSEVIASRQSLHEIARGLGLDSLPSEGNFVLLGCPPGGPLSATMLFENLKSQGIITRPMQSYGLSDHLRVTIGSPEEMDSFQAALDKLLASGDSP